MWYHHETDPHLLATALSVNRDDAGADVAQNVSEPNDATQDDATHDRADDAAQAGDSNPPIAQEPGNERVRLEGRSHRVTVSATFSATSS